MRTLDKWLEPEPDTPSSYNGIRRHHPAPPEPIIAAVHARPVGPRPIIIDMSWAANAACKGQPTNWWVPSNVDMRGLNEREPTVDAIALCSSCPVKTECRDHALEHHEEGYWGGTTERDRRRIRRNRVA